MVSGPDYAPGAFLFHTIQFHQMVSGGVTTSSSELCGDIAGYALSVEIIKPRSVSALKYRGFISHSGAGDDDARVIFEHI